VQKDLSLRKPLIRTVVLRFCDSSGGPIPLEFQLEFHSTPAKIYWSRVDLTLTLLHSIHSLLWISEEPGYHQILRISRDSEVIHISQMAKWIVNLMPGSPVESSFLTDPRPSLVALAVCTHPKHKARARSRERDGRRRDPPTQTRREMRAAEQEKDYDM
jgi:hypothetical protein